MVPYLAFMGFAALAATFRRIPPLWVAFILVALVFVGLRYETAFDWPTYKEEFDVLGHTPLTFGNIAWAMDTWRHEAGYVALAFLSAKTLPAYEWLQLIVFAFFLSSVGYLSSAVHGRRDGWALYIILAFLMFSLLMSTMRQCVAISLFNIALGLFIKRPGNMRSAVFFALSLMFHVSMVIYIAIFLAARINFAGGGRPLTVTIKAILAGIGANLFIFGVEATGMFPKLSYYLARSGQNSMLEMIFFTAAMLTIFVFSVLSIPAHQNSRRVVLFRYCAISAAIAISLLGFVPTFRNRIFYELVILSAVLVPLYIQPATFRMALVSLSSFFFIAQFEREAAIGFVPYQNYVAHQISGERSNGWLRQRYIRDIHKNNF